MEPCPAIPMKHGGEGQGGEMFPAREGGMNMRGFKIGGSGSYRRSHGGVGDCGAPTLRERREGGRIAYLPN